MTASSLVYIFLFVFLLGIVPVYSAVTAGCDAQTTINGQNYDLSSLVNQVSTYTDATKGYLYTVAFCGFTSVSGCTSASVCQAPITGGSGTVIGVPPPTDAPLNTSLIGNAGLSGIQQTYNSQAGAGTCSNGQARMSYVSLICDSSKTTPEISSVNELASSGYGHCIYNIQVLTIAGCPSTGPTATVVIQSTKGNAPNNPPSHSHHMEGGWWFVIIVLILVVVYVVVGVSVQAIRGNRGLEMIPNLEFWKDFPSLIKDGCVFAFYKITCRSDYSAL
jgi:hypothetical protein